MMNIWWKVCNELCGCGILAVYVYISKKINKNERTMPWAVILLCVIIDDKLT